MESSVPNNIWFAAVLVSYRKKDTNTISMVVMSFGVRADTRPKALGIAESVCDRVVGELQTDSAILAIRATVSDQAGEGAVIDSPEEMEIVR